MSIQCVAQWSGSEPGMLGTFAYDATFRFRTAIEPDYIALLARDVAQRMRVGRLGLYVRFDGATPGRLLFSVRSRLSRSELMSFEVNIAADDCGHSTIDARIVHHGLITSSSDDQKANEHPPGYAMYQRYAREMATAVGRFDPLSTVVSAERRRL